MKAWIVIFMCLTIAFSSCRATKDSVSGVYIFRDKHNSEFTEALHLKQDGTFNFQLSTMFVPYPRLIGNWKLVGRKVYLEATNISVLPDGKSGDTLGFKNWSYEVRNNKLIRVTWNGHRRLKKVKGHYKTFKLDYQPF